MAASTPQPIKYDPSIYAGYTEYLINERLFGTLVYRAKPPAANKTSAPELAVKVVPRQALVHRKPHHVRKEAILLTKLNHVNVINLLSAFYNDSREIYELHLPFLPLPLSVLLELPTFSAYSLPQGLHLQTSNPFSGISPPRLHGILSKSIIFQILRAIEHLHTQTPPVAHRDINPSNILFTRDGIIKLADFGVAWDPSLSQRNFTIVGEDAALDLSNDDDWEETPQNMCSQVATGVFRAPELMYNLKQYDACATDLWSLGVMIAQFFTPLQLQLSEDSDDSEEEEDSSSNETGGDEHKAQESKWPGYSFPKKVTETLAAGEITLPSQATWKREPLFDASRGEIGFLWSIFRFMGTPTKESWPDFPGHQPNASVRFRDAPKQPLRPRLPHILPNNLEPLDMIEKLLAYPPQERLSAKDALNHKWFRNQQATQELVLLPAASVYPIQGFENMPKTYELDGKSFSELLSVLVDEEERRLDEEATLRDEWD